MNYYKRHLGDYARDTGHLTAMEHGIFTLLLDYYYATERPIPRDKAPRIAKANPEETQMVLSEFFKLTDLGWINVRADKEMAAQREKAERNREVGKLGGRPKVSQMDTQAEPKRLPEITLATSHKPVVEETPKPPKKRRKKDEGLTFPEFLQACRDANEKPLASDDPITRYAEDAKIPVEFVSLAWMEFGTQHKVSGKRQLNWRAHFRDAVRRGWIRLWYFNDAGDCVLNAQGIALQNFRETRQNRAQAEAAA